MFSKLAATMRGIIAGDDCLNESEDSKYQCVCPSCREALQNMVDDLNLVNNLESVAEQKEFASKLLKEIRANIDPQAILAGGAPRNWDEGRSAKDYDIYVQIHLEDSDDFDTEGRDLITKLPSFELEIKKESVRAGYVHDIPLLDIVNVVAKGHKTPIQIMVVQKQEHVDDFCEEILKHFDNSLCRIAFDGTRILETQEYIRTRQTDEVTVYVKGKPKDQVRHSFEIHLNKLARDYPNYRFKLEDLP